jgi:hypothetical protein
MPFSASKHPFPIKKSQKTPISYVKTLKKTTFSNPKPLKNAIFHLKTAHFALDLLETPLDTLKSALFSGKMRRIALENCRFGSENGEDDEILAEILKNHGLETLKMVRFWGFLSDFCANLSILGDFLCQFF